MPQTSTNATASTQPATFCRPACRTSLRRRRGPALLLATCLVIAAGCSTRDDPHFNPYDPPGGRRPVLKAADDVADLPMRALDNLDRRLENAAY